jgi:hypothetical protein
MEEHPSDLSRPRGIAQDRTTELKEACDWALQITNLLRGLDSVLSATVKAWNSFTSADGDISYFHEPDVDAPVKSRSVKARYASLQNISAKFQQLEKYQDRIDVLKNSCSDYRDAVSGTKSFKSEFPKRKVSLTFGA